MIILPIICSEQPILSESIYISNIKSFKTNMEARVSHLHIKKAVSVTQYGYFEDKNFPTRQNMEDNHIAIDNLLNDGSGLFGVFDGHGGAEVSQYCANVLPDVFEEEYKNDKNNIRNVFEKTLKKVDEQLKFVGASQCGTTCCLALVHKKGFQKICSVANLGDTRAVLSIGGNAKRVTIDHKVSNVSQQQRVKKQGGIILKGRVGGQLAITRALGDLELKTEGVSNIPDVQEFQVTKDCNFLIIASDGLWDVCEDQKAVDVVQKLQNTSEMAKALVQFSLKNGTKDNVSVLVLKFN